MALPWCGSPLSGWSCADAVDAANEPHVTTAIRALARTRDWNPDPTIDVTPTTVQNGPESYGLALANAIRGFSGIIAPGHPCIGEVARHDRLDSARHGSGSPH